MAFLEVVISTVTLVASVVLIWGMMPIIRHEARSASRNLMVGVMVVLLSSVAHILWFGAGQFVLDRIEPGMWRSATYFAGESTPDVIFGTGFILALFFFYRFAWYLIPESERLGYNLITAPFWPRHVGWIWPKRDRRDGDS